MSISTYRHAKDQRMVLKDCSALFQNQPNERTKKTVYNIGLHIYALCAWIASFFNKKIKLMVDGQRQTYRILRKNIGKNDRVVWFHAASLGEFEQGRPIMERLRKNHPEYKILLTFFSPSGYEVRKDYEGADVICYLPFDTSRNSRIFINLAHPEIAVFIKYEFWHNYLKRLHRRGVKTYSVSSIFRPTQGFFRWWGSAFVLRQFDHFFVQNEKSKQLLHGIGIDCCTITGDTRFDRVIDIRNAAKPLPIVEQFAGHAETVGKGRKVFIAGSSWEPDENIYIPYFNQHRDWKLIIAPHVIKPSHLESIEHLLEGRRCVRYTQLEQMAAKGEDTSETIRQAEVLIIDCFGKLSSIYRYGSMALVGGGFGAGIHNVPEAAVYGIPVLFGPNNHKFREARALLACGGSFEYTDSESFATLVDKLRTDARFLEESGTKAGDYIQQNSGASDLCYQAIFKQG